MTIKNGDMPAMPTKRKPTEAERFAKMKGIVSVDENLFEIGLTKREQFAMAAMQGVWYDLTDSGRLQHVQYTANLCVTMADALLKALEANNE